jgi:hypothetical protein
MLVEQVQTPCKDVNWSPDRRVLLGSRVDMIVALELCHWWEFIPVVLTFIDEDLEVLLQLLVDTLSLPICLWVISCGG